MTRVFAWLMSRGAAGERGQGTVEYVLVMVAVAAIAVVLIAWAKSGSGKSTLSSLFDSVVSVVSQFVRK